MATYSQLESYWRKIATECDRCKLVEIGRTAEDRPQYMMIISSPENIKIIGGSRRGSPMLKG